jgi:hypothetical protein
MRKGCSKWRWVWLVQVESICELTRHLLRASDSARVESGLFQDSALDLRYRRINGFNVSPTLVTPRPTHPVNLTTQHRSLIRKLQCTSAVAPVHCESASARSAGTSSATLCQCKDPVDLISVLRLYYAPYFPSVPLRLRTIRLSILGPAASRSPGGGVKSLRGETEAGLVTDNVGS